VAWERHQAPAEQPWGEFDFLYKINIFLFIYLGAPFLKRIIREKIIGSSKILFL